MQPNRDAQHPSAGTHSEPYSRFAIVLFWAMFLAGGVSLAACLILPAWFDYERADARLEAARRQNDALRTQITDTALQIEHHARDDDYNARYVREEFNIRTTDVQSVPVDASNVLLAQQETTDEPAPAGTSAWAARIVERTRDNPVLALYVRDQSRPAVMVASAVLVIVALTFLGARPPRAARAIPHANHGRRPKRPPGPAP